METVKKVWSIVSTVLVALVVLVAVFLMGSRVMGYRVYTVISGSMEPSYSVGDLVYVKPVDSMMDIQVGDPITFVLNEELTVATHRVILIDTEKQCFYTQGDANNAPDANPVHFKNVIGVVQFSIPKLGYVSDFIQHPPGMYITIAAIAVLMILVFLPDFGGKKTEAHVSAQSVEAEAAAEENAKLKAELEALKAQLEKKE